MKKLLFLGLFGVTLLSTSCRKTTCCKDETLSDDECIVDHMTADQEDDYEEQGYDCD